MRAVLLQGAASGAGLFALTLSYAFGCFVFTTGAVSCAARVSLYGACVLAFVAIRAGRVAARGVAAWMAVAFHAALFAAIFFGANGALDILHGPHRPGPGVARSLGGLALWFVLCPGIVSLALGQAVSGALSDFLSTAPAGRPRTHVAGSGSSAPRG